MWKTTEHQAVESSSSSASRQSGTSGCVKLSLGALSVVWSGPGSRLEAGILCRGKPASERSAEKAPQGESTLTLPVACSCWGPGRLWGDPACRGLAQTYWPQEASGLMQSGPASYWPDSPVHVSGLCWGENHVFAHFLIKKMKIRLFLTCKSANMYLQPCLVSTKASLVRPVQDKNEHVLISAPASEVTSYQPSTWLVRTVPQRATAFYTKFIRKTYFPSNATKSTLQVARSKKR